ncbi:MAG TPA: nucleoside phosphorylase [Bacteroidales bacterium]|nr:nucleoside phosphorylase [Bacteroidales bacterium]HPT02895.1 nucleoside phosphorylase [Bacteroidales bacterium]
MFRIPESELILNGDGSVYHLHLKPENLAGTVIVVGDPGRVPEISKHFDRINFKVQNREMVTHTGYIGRRQLSVLSTGMGTDNLDIVMNELDAVVNIDLERREPRQEHTTLNIIRLGTSGSLQADIAPGEAVASTHGIGLDGLLYFYADNGKVTDADMANAFVKHTGWDKNLPGIYAVPASQELLSTLGKGLKQGITLTAPGFYGPQGREVRLKTAFPQLNHLVESFEYQGNRIVNFEMETSALYGLGRLLGHETLTICSIVANRVAKTYAPDYKKDIEKLIQQVLSRLVA